MTAIEIKSHAIKKTKKLRNIKKTTSIKIH